MVIGVAKGTVSAIAYARLGDITSSQFRELAAIQRDLGASVRITNRQNLAFRDLTGRPAARALRPAGRHRHGRTWRRTGPGRRLLPGGRHLQPGRHPEPRPGRRHRQGPRKGRPGRRGRRADQHLGLHQQLRAAPYSRHRVQRRRAAGARKAGARLPAPARRARGPDRDRVRPACHAACRPRLAPRRPCGSWAGSPKSARPARTSPVGCHVQAGPKTVAADLADLDNWPSPEERPDYYIDFDETGPYVAEVGVGECAGA